MPRDGITPVKSLGYKPIYMRVTGHKSTLLKSFCPRSRPKYDLWTVLVGRGCYPIDPIAVVTCRIHKRSVFKVFSCDPSDEIKKQR